MKKRNIAILIVSLGLFVLWYFGVYSSNDENIQESPADLVSEDEAMQKDDSEEVEVAKDVLEEENSDDGLIPAQRWYDFHLDANQPIVFYGKVEDQDGNPVPDVEIKCNTSSYSMVKDGNRDVKEYTLTSDANGLFSIRAGDGLVLHFTSFKAEGYSHGRGLLKSFGYGKYYGGNHVPDQNNPYVFHLWKGEAAAVTLLEEKIYVRTEGKGNRYFVDLDTGSVSSQRPSNYDLIVTLESHRAEYEKQFDWSYRVETNGGGLQEASSYYAYEAPEEGYASVYSKVHSFSKNPKEWDNIYESILFYKSADNKYSSIELTAWAFEKKILLKVLTNPSGSRNLKPK